MNYTFSEKRVIILRIRHLKAIANYSKMAMAGHHLKHDPSPATPDLLCTVRPKDRY